MRRRFLTDTLQSKGLAVLHEIVERIMGREKVRAGDILEGYEAYYALSGNTFVDDVGAIYFAVYRLNGQNTGRVFSSSCSLSIHRVRRVRWRPLPWLSRINDGSIEPLWSPL